LVIYVVVVYHAMKIIKLAEWNSETTETKQDHAGYIKQDEILLS